MLTKADINKTVKIKYRRDKNIYHTFTGIVFKVRKQSFTLLVNDEMKVSIGFRNIKEREFIK